VPGETLGGPAAAGAGLPGGHGTGVERRLSGPAAERPGGDRPLPRRQEVPRGGGPGAGEKSPGLTRRSCRRPGGRNSGR
jgi:hypothetical protein